MEIAVGNLILTPIVIPISTSNSGVISTAGLSLCGIQMPAAFTGSALTFLACSTVDGTYLPVYNGSGAVSYTVAASRYIAIDPKDFYGILFLKIVSGGTEAAARTLICSMKGI